MAARGRKTRTGSCRHRSQLPCRRGFGLTTPCFLPKWLRIRSGLRTCVAWAGILVGTKYYAYVYVYVHDICANLYYIILYYIILYCTVLYDIISYFIILCYIILSYLSLSYPILYYTRLYHILLYYTILDCIILSSILIYYTMLYYMRACAAVHCITYILKESTLYYAMKGGRAPTVTADSFDSFGLHRSCDPFLLHAARVNRKP